MVKFLKRTATLFLAGAIAFCGAFKFPAEIKTNSTVWAASRGASMEDGLNYTADDFSGTQFNGTNVYEISSDDAVLFRENIKNAASIEISIRFKVASSAKQYINLLEIFDKSDNSSDADETTVQSSIAVIVSTGGVVYFEAGSCKTGTDWQASTGVNIADGAFHTLEISVSANSMKCRIDDSAEKEVADSSGKNTKNFMTAFFGGTADGYKDWRQDVDSVVIGGLSADSYFNNAVYANLNGEISAVTVSGVNSSEITGGGVAAGMFEAQSLDNTWLFGGGAEVQGRFAEIGGIRNYIGQFEEYIRWVKRVDSTLLGLQRYTVNAGKAGEDAVAFAAGLEGYIEKIHPKAVVYMVGPEDYCKGEEGLPEFREAISDIILTSLAMHENGGYAVIQLPHATRDSLGAEDAVQYANAAKETALAIASDAGKAERMAIVDHMKQTDTDQFKSTMLTADGLLNADGHYEIAKQFTKAVCGDTAGFPEISDSWTEEEAPETYLNLIPEVTASGHALTVRVPENEKEVGWQYILTIEDVKITGTAYGNPFVIENLPQNKAYELTVRTADGSAQLAAVEGTIADGATAEAVGAKSGLPQLIREKVEQTEDSLTWLFMGDSITHAAAHTHGYDGIAQIFEKYLKEDLGRMDDLVVNTAVSGATTVRTLANIDQRMTKYKPDIVSIMLGTNDSRELSTADYIANMKEIVTKIRETVPDALIIFRSPVPAKSWGGSNQFPGENGYISSLKAAAEEDGNILFIDQYTEWSEAFAAYPYLYNAAYYYGDGNVHPGGAGQLWMAQKMIRECGLNTNTKIANLSYQFDYLNEESRIKPEVELSNDKDAAAVSKTALNTAYTGGEIGSITVTFTDASGRTYTKSSGLDGDEARVELPTDCRYTVEVTADLKGNTAKKVTFAAQDILLTQETGTEEDQQAADDVMQMMEEITELEGTKDYEAAVKDAENAYQQLTNIQKLMVSNEKLQILADAKLSIDKKAADAAIAKINAIGTVENTTECRQKIEDARAAYQALSDSQKLLVSNAHQKRITEAETLISDYDAADAVIAKIDAIGTVKNTAECRQKIEDARAAYQALTDGQRQLILDSQLKILTDAEEEINRQAESERKDREVANAVIAKIDAIGVVVNTAECRQKIESARAAYQALTEGQKQLIPAAKLKVLTDAEAAYAAIAGSGNGGTQQGSGTGNGGTQQGSGTGDGGTQQKIEKGKTYKSGDFSYKVLDTSKRTAEVVSAEKKKAKLAVPDTAVIGTERYSIISIAAGAFKNNKKATSAEIGKNIESIGKNAFSGCSKISKITIKSTKLKKIDSKAFYNCKVLKMIQIKSKVLKSVGANALKGIHKNAVIKVPSSSLKTYRKKFAKKGQKKTVSIKKA